MQDQSGEDDRYSRAWCEIWVCFPLFDRNLDVHSQLMFNQYLHYIPRMTMPVEL